MAFYHLALFGAPELRGPDGTVVRLRTYKQFALLVYLAIEGRLRPASRDQLADLLWSDAEQSKARHSLSQALSAVRGALGGKSVECGRDSIRLQAAIHTDLDCQRLEELTGDVTHPLRDLERYAGADWAQWVDGVRARCRKHVRDLLARELEMARSGGNVAAVHEVALSLYSVDPDSDGAAYVLAERELLKGDTGEAIRFLRTHLGRAERDVGRSPADLKRLLRRIENGGHPVPAPPRPQNAAPLAPPEETFVGREPELARLEQAWSEARKGSFVGCLVTGDTGIGKSALVRHFATSIAARGAPVLMASCQEIGAAIPYSVTADLIHELSREPGLNATDPAWLSEASRVYPAIRTRFPGVPDPPTVPGDSIPLRLAEALFHMIEAVADGGPVLVVLDDVPHMDPASINTIHALTTRLDRTPLQLIGTRRSGGDSGLASKSWMRTMEVSPLPKDDMHRLVSTLSRGGPQPEGGLLSEVVDLACGNPYFAEMLVRDWKDHLRTSLAAARASGGQPPEDWQPPDTLRLAFARQSSKTSPEARELLETLAVAGQSLLLSEVVDLLGWSPHLVDKAMMSLLEEGVLRFDQGRVGFKNELHRAYVYYAIPVDLRRYCHGRIATHLARRDNARTFRTSLHAGLHFQRATMLAEAIEYVVRGATEAIQQGAPGEAEQSILSLLDTRPNAEPERLELLLAKAAYSQGRYVEALDRLAKCSPRLSDKEQFAEAARLEAELRLKTSGPDGAEVPRAALRAVAAARLAKDNRLLVAAIQTQAEAAVESGDREALTRVARKASWIASNGEAGEVRAMAELTHGYCRLAAGDHAEGERSLSSCARQLETIRLDMYLRQALVGVGICQTALGKLDQAARTFMKAAPLAERTGNAHMQGNVWTNLAVVHMYTGAWNEACECFRKASQHAARSSIATTSTMVFTNAAILAIALGAYGQAEELLSRADTIASPHTSWVARAELLYDRAALHLAKREHELAWGLVEKAEEVVRSRIGPPGRMGDREYILRYWTFATQGRNALQTLCMERQDAVARVGVAEQLEIAAFDAWASVECGSAPTPTAKNAFVAAGYFGSLANVIALGTPPPTLPSLKVGQSSAALVSRLYPDAGLGTPPTEVPLNS